MFADSEAREKAQAEHMAAFTEAIQSCAAGTKCHNGKNGTLSRRWVSN
jgi:hypothetical protein